MPATHGSGASPFWLSFAEREEEHSRRMKITSQERSRLIGAWILASFWNGCLVFAGVMIWRLSSTPGAAKPMHVQDLFLLLFPASGLALLLWAIRQTVLSSTYGPTYFVSEVETIPWAARLDGRILFSRPLHGSIGRKFKLTLACVYDEGAGKSRNVVVVWQDSHVIDLLGDAIPVAFSLPTETKPRPLLMASRMKLSLRVKEVGGGFRSFVADYFLPFEGPPDDDPFSESKRNFQRRIQGEKA
jgi:hypothetical protein